MALRCSRCSSSATGGVKVHACTSCGSAAFFCKACARTRVCAACDSSAEQALTSDDLVVRPLGGSQDEDDVIFDEDAQPPVEASDTAKPKAKKLRAPTPEAVERRARERRIAAGQRLDDRWRQLHTSLAVVDKELLGAWELPNSRVLALEDRRSELSKAVEHLRRVYSRRCQKLPI